MTGLVYKSTGSWYTVKSDQGDFIECRIKGKFRMKGIKSTNPIAVGDVVDFELDETSDAITGTIHHIHERKNYIVRKSVNLSHQMHIIASNVDYVFLLITINNPPTTTNFIDRFLVTAEAYGIETILVFNKIDTFDEATLDEQLYLQHIYQEIGYQCLRVSSTESKGIEALKQLMVGKVSMFSGHSGVGKSTLVNAHGTEFASQNQNDFRTKQTRTTHDDFCRNVRFEFQCKNHRHAWYQRIWDCRFRKRRYQWLFSRVF
jgi:ribosome biogenesis GTPase